MFGSLLICGGFALNRKWRKQRNCSCFSIRYPKLNFCFAPEHSTTKREAKNQHHLSLGDVNRFSIEMVYTIYYLVKRLQTPLLCIFQHNILLLIFSLLLLAFCYFVSSVSSSFELLIITHLLYLSVCYTAAAHSRQSLILLCIQKPKAKMLQFFIWIFFFIFFAFCATRVLYYMRIIIFRLHAIQARKKNEDEKEKYINEKIRIVNYCRF